MMSDPNSIETDVLIAGAGPVGLVLAMVLAKRGVRVAMLEPRRRLEPPSVKCNHVSARSMEIFRRLGVANLVRNAGLPEDYPHDISYRTTATGVELTRIPIPCRRDRYTDKSGPDANWPTSEPPHRINQIYLEPILFEYAEGQQNIRILNREALISFSQDENSVSIISKNEDTGKESTYNARYLVGCDGGKSIVRKMIGSRLEGDAVVQRVQSTLIRAPGLLSLFKQAPAWATFSLNPRRCGNTYAIDGKEMWLVHNYLRDGEPDFDAVDRDACLREILGVDEKFQYEMLSKEDWFGRRLLANKFRDRRVFICGDAAHLWVPYAGYGMNAGIADAENLGWTLAARIQGWGGEAILDAYEAERRPITEQVSYFAMNHAQAMSQQRTSVPPGIEEQSDEGAELRSKLGTAAYELNVQQYCCAGLNFGYFYDQSPLVVYDGEAFPPYTMGSYEASSVPGCRTPYVELEGGTPLYDVLGIGYTMLRFDANVDVTDFEALARERGMPLMIVDIHSHDSRCNAYSHKLVLSRPDQHIAWRGDKLPENVAGLIDKICAA
ncbi:FAD-dependent oxidoreductase [Advenella mimigardefordensis]|uniref:Putative FAD-binding domain-containing monooxygenase n=2 Tax=Advenella mimigardefordensis TaxID=302406 RepID=W0PAH9_ADVMD|nr:FAD-dependent oxidoreductase [Advenella mimigardefordensis]AHG63854.1 putative FAD-binding domain-containing monooxygenase [Advenella mimigardefordensis DPN7]